MEVLSLLEKLESILGASTRVPATRKALVDVGKALELLDRIREALPRDLQEAEELLARRDSILNQALMEARRIKAAADDEARARVEENEVTREAYQRAEAILNEARNRADLLLSEARREANRLVREAEEFADARIGEANRYAQEILLKLESVLSTQLATVRRGLDLLDLEQAEAPKPQASPQTAGA